jgi:hypothetical protein
MIGRIPHWLLIVGIVTATNGCDNVSWGGMSLRLEGPPGDTLAPPPGAPGTESDAGPQRIHYGPLLYAGIRQGDSALVVPVAEFIDGRLQPLPQGEAAIQLAGQVLEERLSPGQKLTLFHQGTRIGTLTVSSPLGTATDYCPPRAQALGHLELIPSASGAQRFLALENPSGRQWPFGVFQTLAAERAQRNAAQNLAGEALNQLRAQWPAALQNIRQDLQLFQLSTGETPSVVASFLFQDQMEVGAAADEAYSLLILGEPRGTRFERTFTWYRRVGDEGKGAPRFFSWMDWDGDGEEEVLLEVFGEEARWWAALDRENGVWSVAFQDSCGGIETQGPPEEDAQGGSR